MELMKGDSLEGSAHMAMYNPHILPLISKCMTIAQSVENNY